MSESEAVAGRLADTVAQHLAAGLSARGHAALAVSGGRTPVPFFAALRENPLDWSRVTVTLVDDRWVPESHPDSNAGLLRQHLLTGKAATATFLPLVQADSSPEAALPALEARLAALPWPLDAVILGMGGDGHTASLFPHMPGLAAALDTGGVARAMVTPVAGNPAHRRVTLTLPAILDTRFLALHATGADKAAVLARAREDGPVDDLPVRAILRQTRIALTLCLA